MGTRHFTILRSNDMRGDFLAEEQAGGGPLHGGLALLSAYVNKVRAEEENVFYLIAGDMVQGSLIDSDYRGISTIDIITTRSTASSTSMSPRRSCWRRGRTRWSRRRRAVLACGRSDSELA